jgi:hypothetical protein
MRERERERERLGGETESRGLVVSDRETDLYLEKKNK